MYTRDGQIYIGLADQEPVTLQLNMSNRHGLIAGASGTGKTITMKAMAPNPDDRYLSADDMLADLEEFRAGHARRGFREHGEAN